jgi:hypothetical protein
MKSMWVDPNWFEPQHRVYPVGHWRMMPVVPSVPTAPVPTDEQIRKIVREEIAELPIKYDVPDTLED